MGDFEKTDISRQLREANVPESAYLYVETLWTNCRDYRKTFHKIEKMTTYAKDYIDEIYIEAHENN